MRVLLVDDDPSVLRFLEDVLQARGHEVVSVQPLGMDDAARCADVAASFCPELLIVDLQMPIDPAGVAAAVRRAQVEARVILCTGMATSHEDRDRIGVDGLLAKPFTTADLERAIAAAGAAG